MILFRDRSAARGGATGRAGWLHPGFLAAAAAVLVGVAGLWYGASAAGSGGGEAGGAGSPVDTATPTTPALGTTTAVGDIVVRNAYIRQPNSTRQAIVSMSITNSGSEPDVLLSVYCGAARSTAFRGAATAPSVQRGPTPGSYRFAPGAILTLGMRTQLVLTGLASRLRAGDRVSLRLSFQRTGQVLVELPVIQARGVPVTASPSP